MLATWRVYFIAQCDHCRMSLHGKCISILIATWYCMESDLHLFIVVLSSWRVYHSVLIEAGLGRSVLYCMHVFTVTHIIPEW